MENINISLFCNTSIFFFIIAENEPLEEMILQTQIFLTTQVSNDCCSDSYLLFIVHSSQSNTKLFRLSVKVSVVQFVLST